MFEAIKNFFGFGHIRITKSKGVNNVIRFEVNSLQDCLKIREHFINFPLMSYKLVHFLLWCSVIDLKIKKEHLTLPGLLKIIALKAHSPFELSPKMLDHFPNYTPLEAPKYSPNFINMNIHWIFGFMNADGHFIINIKKNQNTKSGKSIHFLIQITQHNKSLIVLEEIKKFIGAGKIYSAGSDKNISNLKITNLLEIKKFIELFREANLQGAKAIDYSDFCMAIKLVNHKVHLSKGGGELLENFSKNMNVGRTKFE